MRHEVIAHNIANVNTPQFKRSEVEFEKMLAKELYGDRDKEGKLQLVRTRDNHLPIGHLPFRAQAKEVVDNTTIMRTDRKNVDIDIEMASLAKNQIYYNALMTEIGSYISRVKTSITSTEG
jgi:flagellar basal-body rod protein FlgB